MQINRKTVVKNYTHEGGKASRITPLQELKRSIMSCLLWENSFYEDGESIADRIKNLVLKVKPEEAASIAKEARNEMNLRHVPLWIARWLATKGGRVVSDLLTEIIQRPDELTEFLSLYWKDGKCPISKQVKIGLAKAFEKFDEYTLAKYNRETDVKLKDVLFMVHAKPKDEVQADLWKRLIAGELKTPDTWEVALSTGKDKKETWERLIKEKRLGDLAFLRNLRNMLSVNVDKSIMRESLLDRNFKRIFPYRFFAAAENAQCFADELEKKMLASLAGYEKLSGKTVLMVDVSGSMKNTMSEKSKMTRMDAACAIAILAREICEDVSIFTFSNRVVEIPNIHGFGLAEKVKNSQMHSGTYLWQAVGAVNNTIKYDRMIIFTDEQAHDDPVETKGKLYIVNVASNQNGIAYHESVHIDGFSEKIIDFILEYEKAES